VLRSLRRTLGPFAPKTLFGRSLLIVVLPLVLLQLVLGVIFYNRHWDTVTRWLAAGVAGEVALLVEELAATRDPAVEEQIIERFRRHTDLRISLERNGRLATALATAGIDDDPRGRIDAKILEQFGEALERPFAVDLRGADEDDRVAIYVQAEEGLLRVLASRKRVTSTTTWLLLGWMLGASLMLAATALYFMRLQIRPIRRLARAAESFGKGRDVGDVKLQGALEIRQAAHAFNLMRHRILRHVGQRTEMLAAVSHDLRTPLTRMRLGLELLGSESDQGLADLRADVEEMAKLVESYLAFARGEGQEAAEPTALRPILEGMRERAERSGVALEISMDRPVILQLRPLAFRRCLANLVDNACRYAGWIGITVRRREEFVEIAVEDDGPGIPEGFRDKVLQPFFRLDESRGKDAGTGLGLTIARDVVLGHGGDLRLDRSSRGGLRALMLLPA
jgi:two-component system, OmpR family, osmolarity sensor histidine kinase EnvZ